MLGDRAALVAKEAVEVKRFSPSRTSDPRRVSFTLFPQWAHTSSGSSGMGGIFSDH
jgi:hypothetical protein